MYKTKLLAAALFASLSTAPAFAVDENNTSAGLTAAGAPLALHGYDPVALHHGRQIEGSAVNTFVHNGIAYYFASQRNLTDFKSRPNLYTPQFGGYCAYGVSVGKKFDGDPRYSTVVDGRLYVFLNREIYEAFEKSPAQALKKARRNWRSIRTKPSAAL